MNMNLFFGISLLLASTGAQAVTCSGNCTISYTNIVGRLSPNASYNQKKDFEINCTRSYGGSVRQVSSTWEYICETRGTRQTLATGQGYDLFQARTAARNNCSQQASSSGYSNAVGSIYGDMNCN